MKRCGITAGLLAIFLILSGSTVWEGAAAPGDNLPPRGLYAATNSFPRNTTLQVTNLGTGQEIRVLVIAGLDVPGLLIALSPEAAASLGIESRSIGRVRMSESADPLGTSLLSGDGDLSPSLPPPGPVALEAAYVPVPSVPLSSPEFFPPPAALLAGEDFLPLPEPAFIPLEAAGLSLLPSLESSPPELVPVPLEALGEELPPDPPFPEAKLELADFSPAPAPSPSAPSSPQPASSTVTVTVRDLKMVPAEERPPSVPGFTPPPGTEIPPIGVAPPPPAAVPPSPLPPPVTETAPSGAFPSATLTTPEATATVTSSSPYITPTLTITVKDLRTASAGERPPPAPRVTPSPRPEIPPIGAAVPPPAVNRLDSVLDPALFIGPIAAPPPPPHRPAPPVPVVPAPAPAAPSVSVLTPVIPPIPERVRPAPPPVPVVKPVPAPVPVSPPLPPVTPVIPPIHGRSRSAPPPILVEPVPPPSLEIPPIPGRVWPVPALEIPPSPDFSAPHIAALERGKYYLQLGLYTRPETVEAELRRLGRQYPLAVQSTGVPGSFQYRVLVGPVSQGESGALLRRFKGLGYTGAFVRSGS
jgi:hypothetical protein